ncbi:MAG: serine/threonine protein kinase [Spirochaetaceae bacterium]|nr:serine/threonine protein kinase [Spirochaetaceae bacterium]
MSFDLLTPYVAAQAVESVIATPVDGALTGYPSYVNRVYGFGAEDGRQYVAKFYRPGRWSWQAIEEEHRLVAACAAEELPVVAPLADGDGETLQAVTAADGDAEQEFLFAVYPKRGGRNFDADRDSDWLRIGALVGRLHSVMAACVAAHRLTCTPRAATARFIEELSRAGVVAPDAAGEFFALADRAVDRIAPLFEGVPLQPVHGDCHRGNILDRAAGGLLLIDFDDLMVAPAVQDLWLLLPGRVTDSRRELELLLEGYEQFHPFDRRGLLLIEPLRLMRMIYYLAWSALQRHDPGFRASFPRWGGAAFWTQEVEDLRTQLSVIEADLP